MRTHAALVLTLVVYGLLPGQSERMAVEGSIQLDDASVPRDAHIRVLRPDGSVARTISPYASNPSRFGVRFSAQDGFLPGDSMSFRIVLSERDSFPARIAGSPLYYQPSPPQELAVSRILLFRNHLPVIRRPLPDTVINEQDFFRFKITAQDADGDRLIHRFVSAAPGAYIDYRNGYITWTPGYDQAGTYEFVIGVADDMEEAFSRASRIVVRNLNRPPRIVGQPEDRIVQEGEVLTVHIDAVDEDGDSLSYYLLENEYKASFYSPNGVFNWPLDHSSAGGYQFICVISDGEISDTSFPFRVLVQNTNRSPAFRTSLFDTIAVEGEMLQYGYEAEDPDGDPVYYALELAPEGVNLTPEGHLSWTPAFDQAGSYIIIVSSSDGSAASESVARVTVLNRNRRPAFVQPVIPIVRRNPTYYEGSYIELTWPSAQDPDADDTLRYSMRLMGRDLDTTFTDIADTSLGFLGGGVLGSGNEFRWMVTVTDGYESVVLRDTSSFRLVPRPAVLTEEPTVGDVQFSFALGPGSSESNSSATAITYSLAERSDIVLAVYTMLGERIVTLEEGERDAGTYQALFDAATLPSGIYMFKLEAHPLEGNRLRDFVSTRRMVLVR